jgi:hypothetical protein
VAVGAGFHLHPPHRAGERVIARSSFARPTDVVLTPCARSVAVRLGVPRGLCVGHPSSCRPLSVKCGLLQRDLGRPVRANSLLGRLADEGDDKPKVQLQRARAWALLALGNLDEAGRAIDDAAARAGDARYERACNDLCLANIALLNGDADEAHELQARADQAFQELDVINLPRFPWTR